MGQHNPSRLLKKELKMYSCCYRKGGKTHPRPLPPAPSPQPPIHSRVQRLGSAGVANIAVHVSFSVFISSGYIPRGGIAKSYGGFMLAGSCFLLSSRDDIVIHKGSEEGHSLPQHA